MSDIRMADGAINFEGEWLTAEELKRRIKEKMDAGDMKFADMASALQELNEALENSHKLEVKIVLTKVEYDKLRAMGGDDDNASVRKAIRAFVGGRKPKTEAKPAAPAKPAAEVKPAAPAKPTAEVTPGPSAKPTKEVKPDPSAKPAAEVKPAEPEKPVMEKPSKKEDTIPCTKCKTPIPIPTSARPLELECEFCGTSVLLPMEEMPAEPDPAVEASPAGAEVPAVETNEKPSIPETPAEPKRTDHFIG